jgi:hypothetical protein
MRSCRTFGGMSYEACESVRGRMAGECAGRRTAARSGMKRSPRTSTRREAMAACYEGERWPPRERVRK